MSIGFESRAPTARGGVDWVSTTLDIVAEESVDKLTVRALCAVAGISRPTFYSRFGNVDGLLAEVWLERGAQWLNSLIAQDYQCDAPSQALARIVAVARRKPELHEVVAPVVRRWWQNSITVHSAPSVAWLVSNRLGLAITASIDHGVHAIAPIESVMFDIMSRIPRDSLGDDRSEPEFALASPQTDDQVLDAAIAVIAAAGYHDASMSRIARYIHMTTGAIYPHFTTTEELLELAFTTAQQLVVRQNEKVWRDSGFSVRNFGQFISEGLSDDRALWRFLRLETLLAAPSSSRIRESARSAMADSASALHGVVSETTLPDTIKPVVHYLFHTLGVGFSVIHLYVPEVAKLPHIAMAELLGAELKI